MDLISNVEIFQVGLNCDDVADWLHANNPDMSVDSFENEE